MHDIPSDLDNVDERLQQLHQAAHDLSQKCCKRSSRRVAQEARRLAKAEQRLIPYMNVAFYDMIQASDMLEPEATRDVAVELIALLESPDRARLIQSDLPEIEYDETIRWMSACAYDNLAQSTAAMQGYNSEGMHQCITDGLHVCRRTGKLECLTCFREYATQVYEAADDLEMAMHFARLGAEQQVVGPHDRRWVGMHDLARLHRLQGRLDESLAAEERALRVCDTYHTPLQAYLKSRATLQQTLVLLGRADEPNGYLQAVCSDGASPECPFGTQPASGEYPELEHHQALATALAMCLDGKYAEAFDLLVPWDRLLVRNRHISHWFEIRLRLIATQLLAGRRDRAQALAGPLEERARLAQDWLTLRRLARLCDESASPSPAALAGEVHVGPFAARGPQVVVPDAVPDETPIAEPTAAEQVASAAPALAERLHGLEQRLREADEETFPQVRADVVDEMVGIPASDVSLVEEARWLLYTIRFLVGKGERGRTMWDWAQAMAAKFPQDADVQSLLGALGAALRDAPAAELTDVITEQQLERIFKQALSLDPNLPWSFARAGAFYQGLENLGEAERCFARGFRLARTNGYLAQHLAEVYQQTDRPRDALAALDLCLREGCEDPDVTWEAALAAGGLEQYDSQLLYLDQFEKWRPDTPWVQHYRALALLELDRPQEALAAAEEEMRRNPDCAFVTLLDRACCLGPRQQLDEFRSQLQQVLAASWVHVDYLTLNGFRRLLGRLWTSSACLPEDDPLRCALDDRLLASGLMPDDFFARRRSGGEPVDGVNFYRCVVTQPLDAAWPESGGCLPGETDWQSYALYWGVLARSEEEAQELVLDTQSRCYGLTAAVVETNMDESGYRDVPGIVWQGMRQGEVPSQEADEAPDDGWSLPH